MEFFESKCMCLFSFRRNHENFFQSVFSILHSIIKHESSGCSILLSTFDAVSIFTPSHSGRYIMLPHCGSHLHFPYD